MSEEARQAALNILKDSWRRTTLLDLAREVSRAYLAAADRLRWTSEPPKVPGWWWWRFSDEAQPVVKRVMQVGNGLSIPDVLELKRVQCVKGEWAGPLTPPE